MAQKRVGLVHTSFALVDVLTKALNELAPEAELAHFVDGSVLRDVMKVGHLTPAAVKRMVYQMLAAETAGSDVILNCCSSVGEAVDVGRALVSIPIVKIDDAMTEEAVQKGQRIGVLATVQTTLDPTARLIERKAAEAGKTIQISKGIAEGAFDILQSGDAKRHDEMVLAGIQKMAGNVDVIVLAQASMARLVPQLGDSVKVPVLSSPRSGAMRVRKALGL